MGIHVGYQFIYQMSLKIKNEILLMQQYIRVACIHSTIILQGMAELTNNGSTRKNQRHHSLIF